MAAPQNFRAFKSQLTISYGVVSFRADLVSPKASDRDIEFESACPDCHDTNPKADATPVSVRYHCPAGHGPFAYAEVLKATRQSKALRIVGTSVDVNEARADAEDASSELVLRPYIAEEVERQTYPLGSAYVLTQKTQSLAFPVFLALLDHQGRVAGDSPMVLIGEVVLRKSRKLVQLRRWNDLLVLQELARPDDLKSGFARCEDPLDQRFLEPIQELMAADVQAFDPEDFMNPQRKRVQEFAAARMNAKIPTPPKKSTPVVLDDNLLHLLQQSIQAKKPRSARKTSARKAPARKVS